MSRRVWILAAALVAFGLLLGLLVHDAGRRGAFAGRCSTWSTEPDGALAAYLVLQRSGVPVARRTQDFADLADATALVLLAPGQALPRHERQALLAWVDRGHTLVLLPERPSALLDDLGVKFARRPGGRERFPRPDDELDEPASRPASSRRAPRPASQPLRPAPPVKAEEPPERLRPTQPSLFAAGVAEVEAVVAGTLTPATGQVDSMPLLADERHRTVGAIVRRKAGGRVVVVAAPDLFTNRRLGTADNAALLDALARHALATPGRAPRAGEHPAPRLLAVDEFHHGFMGSRTVAGYLWRGNLRWVVLQLLFIGVFAVLRAWRRFGPVQEPPEATQTARDYLQAMARIYRLGGHRAAAADKVWGHVRRQVTTRLGLKRNANDAAPEIERIGLTQLWRAYPRAEQARATLDRPGADDGDLLAFGRAVAAVEAEARRSFSRRRGRREAS